MITSKMITGHRKRGSLWEMFFHNLPKNISVNYTRPFHFQSTSLVKFALATISAQLSLANSS